MVVEHLWCEATNFTSSDILSAERKSSGTVVVDINRFLSVLAKNVDLYKGLS